MGGLLSPWWTFSDLLSPAPPQTPTAPLFFGCPGASKQPRGWKLPALGSLPGRNRGGRTPPTYNLLLGSNTPASTVQLRRAM